MNDRGMAQAIGSLGGTPQGVTKEHLARVLANSTCLHACARELAQIATALDERIDVMASQAGVAELELWEHPRAQEPSRGVEEFLGALREALGLEEPTAAAA